VEKNDGRDVDDPKPALATNSALISSDPDQAVIHEEAIADDDIPFGWTRRKLAP
jgi:hypothetical protein